MGSHLSEPETGKQTEEISNEHYVVASSSMQGWRLGKENGKRFEELQLDGFLLRYGRCSLSHIVVWK